MLETLFIVVGGAIALYGLLHLLDWAVSPFRQSALQPGINDNSQKCETTVSDGLTAVSFYGSPSDFDLGMAHYPIQSDEVGSETAEALSRFAEGGQSLLEGATEPLEGLVESVIHAVSEL